uniref:Alpha/beta hydrolase fold-3 domain-containing protein n=1 Tax=Panagrolaimus sp. ES5 TaxID=591445 RepID=A0AC34G8A8_9BILA
MDATHVFIFFHGGYWQAGSKADVGPMIDLVVNGAGIPCVSVGYDYATSKPLKEIAAQALTALKFIKLL